MTSSVSATVKILCQYFWFIRSKTSLKAAEERWKMKIIFICPTLPKDARRWTVIEVVTPSPQSTDSCCRHITLVTRIITGSYVTTMRKPQFSEEDPWSQVESSKFRPMFAGVVSFHLYNIYLQDTHFHPCIFKDNPFNQKTAVLRLKVVSKWKDIYTENIIIILLLRPCSFQ